MKKKNGWQKQALKSYKAFLDRKKKPIKMEKKRDYHAHSMGNN